MSTIQDDIDNQHPGTLCQSLGFAVRVQVSVALWVVVVVAVVLWVGHKMERTLGRKPRLRKKRMDRHSK